MEQKIYLQMSEIESKHWWFVGRRKIIKTVIATLDLKANSQILDVGCGTGGNLALLSNFGEVTGVELDDEAIEIARSKKIGIIYKGSLPEGMPSLQKTFDLIILLDVLEHIEDDLGTLSALNTMLAPGGHLIITVPAFPFLWSQHDIEHHHKRRYLKSTLTSCIQKAGLEPKHITYYNAWLFPVVAAVRSIRKIIPSRTVGADVNVPNPIINLVLEKLFSSEREIVRRVSLPFGVSLLAIVQKK